MNSPATGVGLKRDVAPFKTLSQIDSQCFRVIASLKDLRDYFASTVAMGSDEYIPDIVTVSELLRHTNLNTTKKYLYSLTERRMRAVSIVDQIDRVSTKISTEGANEGGGNDLTAGNNWWRCRDLNHAPLLSRTKRTTGSTRG